MFLLILASFTVGGVLQGHTIVGSLLWSVTQSASIALVAVMPITLAEGLLPRGHMYTVVLLGVAVVTWGLSLLVTTFVQEFPNGLDAAWRATVEFAFVPFTKLRAWLVLFVPALSFGLASSLRRNFRPWAKSVRPSILIGLASAVIVLVALSYGVRPPRFVLIAVVVAMILPVSQGTWFLIICCDAAASGKVKLPGQPIESDLPKLPAIDRLLAQMFRGGIFDLVVFVLAAFAGARAYNLLLGVLIAVAVWLLIKIGMALVPRTWMRMLVARKEKERAANFLRYVMHGVPEEDPIRKALEAELEGLKADGKGKEPPDPPN